MKVTMDALYEAILLFKKNENSCLFDNPSGFIDAEDLKLFTDHLNAVLQKKDKPDKKQTVPYLKD